jgi:arylsulfatase A-like enzyme
MRKSFVPLLFALGLCACGGGAEGPNVVLVTLDTTRADYLSCYGFGAETTPHLDRLAEGGTRFDLAMSTAAVTPVSHAAILTGRFNRDHGVRVILAPGGFRLPGDVPTLASELKGRGYKTIAVHSAFPVSPFFGLTQGFDVVHSFEVDRAHEGSPVDAMKKAVRRSDDSVNLVVQELKKAREPFFLWVHLWDPHDPIHVPPKGYEVDVSGSFPDVPAKVLRERALYASELRYMDEQLGRMLDTLDLDETIVAVTADHGQGLEDHGWGGHRVLYQEQIRVPLILHVPGVEQPASVADLVRTVDIAPTVYDYAGVEPPADMSGRSLRALIERTSDEPRLAFAEQINGYDHSAKMPKRPQDDFAYCALDANWKLVWRPNHPDESELFHLAEDPLETSNLWSWEHAEALRLKEALARHGPWVTASFDAAGGELDGGVSAALRNLGYVGEDDRDDGPEWEWVCVRHYDSRSAAGGRCAECESPMILIAAGK